MARPGVHDTLLMFQVSFHFSLFHSSSLFLVFDAFVYNMEKAFALKEVPTNMDWFLLSKMVSILLMKLQY
jgi:hypothetical protein